MELLPEIIKIISDNLPAIITIGLTILSVVLGKKYKKIKRVLEKLFTLFVSVIEASNDDEYTQEEVNKIFNDIRELLKDFTDDPNF